MVNDQALAKVQKVHSEEYCRGGRDLSVSRIKRTVSLFGKVQGKSILDLGSGTGEGSMMLQQLGADVTCADIAEYSVFSCHEAGFDAALSLANALPFCDESFDGVLFMDVIEHVPRKFVVPTLHEIRRVTKTGGKIVIHTMPTIFLERLSSLYGLFNRHHWRRWGVQGGHVNTYSASKLKRDLNLAGLKILHFEIGQYPKDAPFSRIVSPCSSVFPQLFGNDLWVSCCPR